jgi:hypothetical protein
MHANDMHANDMYANDIRTRLNCLFLERLDAKAVGLDASEAYMRDLQNEISETRAAFVGAAVTEIAVARGELSGVLDG